MALSPWAAWADQAGQFDYYVLALSWNAGWCEIEGRAKDAPQCVDEPKSGFALHGLWPQYANGWPEYCATSKPNPPRAVTREEAGLFGSSGSAWHQWDKHGRCTGMSYQDYYDASEMLWQRYQAPEIFMKIEEPMNIAPDVIEDAMHATYPDLNDANMAVICNKGVFQEVRICLDKNFAPTECLGDAAKDCNYSPEFLPSY